MTDSEQTDSLSGRLRQAAEASGVDRLPAEQSVCAFTATPEAIARFKRALTYASAVLYGHAEANHAPQTKRNIEEHAEWLSWGFGRIDAEEGTRS